MRDIVALLADAIECAESGTVKRVYPVNAADTTRVVGGGGGGTAPKSQFGLPESHRLSTICQLVFQITPPLWSAT